MKFSKANVSNLIAGILALTVVMLVSLFGYSMGVQDSPVNHKQVKVSEYVCGEHDGFSTIQNRMLNKTVIVCQDDTEYTLLVDENGKYFVNTNVLVTVDDPVDKIMNPNGKTPEKLKNISTNEYKNPLEQLKEKKENPKQKQQVTKTVDKKPQKSDTINMSGNSVKEMLFN